jgi:hypothetical protein
VTGAGVSVPRHKVQARSVFTLVGARSSNGETAFSVKCKILPTQADTQVAAAVDRGLV